MAANPDNLDDGTGCYVSGSQIRRHSDRRVVATYDNHSDAVDAYMNADALASRLEELALADKIEQEVHRHPVRRLPDEEF